MSIPEGFYYSEDHEWVKVEDGVGTIGITDFAQDELGDIVFVELPQVGDEFDQEDNFGVIESVKAVSDLYMPVSGEVVEINEDLLDQPELVNDEPYEGGWIIKVSLSDEAELDELMNSDEYSSFLEEEA
ncbi:glycine cleavage system protein GcvH [Halanaerobiaceae bacterium Z-7014]|uniref:Glycine cleavage system H protein n=1 Tax=Halonatronomonas betaini TaxID=2778430 RepID=A0A931AW07_9FIRM|nr:glycine cleavage system protein GcvH [Halonatronomonas betaini]MBF8437709.1 glycine cleavage system protein GcvH [Halonatronomonas betaini]